MKFLKKCVFVFVLFIIFNFGAALYPQADEGDLEQIYEMLDQGTIGNSWIEKSATNPDYEMGRAFQPGVPKGYGEGVEVYHFDFTMLCRYPQSRYGEVLDQLIYNAYYNIPIMAGDTVGALMEIHRDGEGFKIFSVESGSGLMENFRAAQAEIERIYEGRSYEVRYVESRPGLYGFFIKTADDTKFLSIQTINVDTPPVFELEDAITVLNRVKLEYLRNTNGGRDFYLANFHGKRLVTRQDPIFVLGVVGVLLLISVALHSCVLHRRCRQNLK